MSEIPKAIGEVIKNAVPASINKTLENLIDKPTKNIGDTIAELWFLAFGGISYRADKRRISYKHGLAEFEKTLNDKIIAIPEEKRVEPKTQIIMNAMHDAESCVEEPDIRVMFAKLIASSVNSDKADLVHPAFSGILRQLTPFDAKLLTAFKSDAVKAIANIRKVTSDHQNTIMRNAITEDIDGEIDPPKSSKSLVRLTQQGLLNLDFSIYLVERDNYRLLDGYLSLLATSMSLPYARPDIDSAVSDTHLTYQKGVAEITEFGRDFLTACT